jgi:hypothetical protein
LEGEIIREVNMVQSKIRRIISISLTLIFVFFLITELPFMVSAKDTKEEGFELSGKAVIMGKGAGYVVIGERHFLIPKYLVIKDKTGKEIPLARIKMPVKAFIRYSIRVNDNVPILRSIDLLE